MTLYPIEKTEPIVDVPENLPLKSRRYPFYGLITSRTCTVLVPNNKK